MFKRIIDFHLDRWKTDPFRKPLLLRGARQVGKTYAVRRLGGRFKSFVEINFERLEGAASIFEKDLAPERLILALSLLVKTPIIHRLPYSKRRADYSHRSQKRAREHIAKSSSFFRDSHPKSTSAIQFSSLNYSVMNKLDSRPLYAAASLAHDTQKEALTCLVNI